MKAKFSKFVFILLLAFLPTQLSKHFWPVWSYVFGLRIDLIAPALYLTDIMVISLLVVNWKMYRPILKFLLIFIFFAGLNIYLSTSWPQTTYKWLKVLEFVLLGYFVATQRILTLKSQVMTLFYSAAAVSVLGIVQFLIGKTIGSVFYWLGERSFNLSTPGIALVGLGGVDHLRSYSIFSHPNSLAGFLGVILIVALLSGKVKKDVISLICLICISMGIVTSFSLAAYFGILVTLFFYLLHKTKIFSILIWFYLFSSAVLSMTLPVIVDRVFYKTTFLAKNISERVDLANIAGNLISRHFLVGEGLGTFIANIPTVRGVFINSWVLQPVHNIFLLITAETGILGLLMFLYFLLVVFRNSLHTRRYNLLLGFVFLIFTGLFDHYWITLQQNIMLLSIIGGLSLRKY